MSEKSDAQLDVEVDRNGPAGQRAETLARELIVSLGQRPSGYWSDLEATVREAVADPVIFVHLVDALASVAAGAVWALEEATGRPAPFEAGPAHRRSTFRVVGS